MASHTIELASFRIEPLLDAEGAFFPIAVVFPDVATAAWLPYRSLYPDTFAGEDMLYTHVTCYLIRGRNQTVLVDGGIGPGPAPLFGNARGALLDELAARGVQPEQVDMVVLTHLHPDHVGWAVLDGRPTFPRARYLVSRIELETFHREDIRAAMHAIVPGYLDACLTPLEQAGVLDTVSEESELTPGLSVALAPGHMPGMLRVQVSDEAGAVWIVADTFTHPAQIDQPEWCSAFDLDREQAIATRRATRERAEREGIALLASHFPPLAGRIVSEHGRTLWRPATH